MREGFRCIGLKCSLKGTKILEKLVTGKKELPNLSDREIDEILEAWESRKYVPINKADSAISSKPGHVEGETEMQYKRRHVAKIVDIIQNLKNYPA